MFDFDIEYPVDLSVASSGELVRDLLGATLFDVILCSLDDSAFFAALNSFEVRTRTVLYSTEQTVVEGFATALAIGGFDVISDYLYGSSRMKQAIMTYRRVIDYGPGYGVEQCRSIVKIYGAALDQVARVQLSLADELVLDSGQARVLQIYAARQSRDHPGDVIVDVVPLTAGQSRATTLRAFSRSNDGTLTASVIAKIMPIVYIRDERERYEYFVAPRLPPAIYAPYAGTVEADAGQTGSILYGFAGQFEHSLSELLATDPDVAAEVVHRLRDGLRNWHDHGWTVLQDVDNIRSEQIRGDALNSAITHLHEIQWTEAENRPLLTRVTTIHGDLHSNNVLVDNRTNPLLIDYGRVTRGVATTDPVALELSTFLYGRRLARNVEWPTVAQAQNWADLDYYLMDCPAASYVRACREWTTAVAAGDDEIAATFYSLAMRQLQYDDTDRQCAVAVVEGAVEHLIRASGKRSL